MASAWGTSWGTSWGNSWGSIVVVEPPAPETGYVNESVRRPRHERIGRPPPQLEPVPEPIFLDIETGQGSQSVSCKVEFLIKGAEQGISGKVTFSVVTAVSSKQVQPVQASIQTKMTGSVRTSQRKSGNEGQVRTEMVAIIKSGGEAMIIPDYAGDEIPDAFFEADQAA